MDDSVRRPGASRITAVAACLAFLFAGGVCAQNQPEDARVEDGSATDLNPDVATPAGESTDLQRIRIDVAYLSSDLLEGRETGTAGESLAAQYIATRFADLGLAAAGADGSAYQPFAFTYSGNPHASTTDGEQRTGRNVLALLGNGAPRTVVIGAHYDHLGYGAFGSRSPGDSLIHNGADDNASGVAAMLAIAARLLESDDASNDYVFVAFSGEELGLYGSKYFVEHLPAGIDSINYMINLDMVGRLGADRNLAVNGVGTSPVWEDVLDDAARAHNLNITKHASGLGPSDHASFYLRDVPVLHLFTGQHQEYHRPEDDSQFIDYAGIRDIASFVVDVIGELDGEGAIPFTSTADEDQTQRARFKVTLGIMPDYVSDVEGLRIDAVLDGRPAARAGLQKGDVIIRLGEVDVAVVDDYMKALSTFEAGDVTAVVVRRGDEILERKVQF